MLDPTRTVAAKCWMVGQQNVCFVHLGKYGDLMIMLPAFKAVAEELGKPVVCIVSKTFSSIFDGVSYVDPWVVDLHWWKGVSEARRMAEGAGYKPVVVKWWDDPGAKPPMQLSDGKTTVLKIHGQSRTIPAREWDSFQASQWRYAGFTMQQMLEWPLVFDRRDPVRESVLRAQYFKPDKRHILFNLPVNGTSPFKHYRAAVTSLIRPNVSLVNLGQIKAHRIYDLLGLYDHAIGLVTSDTATLHLAAASSIPYIAFINNGGSGSIPKGNCILSIRYGQFHEKRTEYEKAIDDLCGAFS